MQGNDFKDSVIVYVVTEVTICISRLQWQLVNLKRTVYVFVFVMQVKECNKTKKKLYPCSSIAVYSPKSWQRSC